MPGDIRKLPAWEFNALCDWMPAIEAENRIYEADIIFTFAQAAVDAQSAKQQAKRRDRYIRSQQSIISRVRDLYSDKLAVMIEKEPVARVDVSKLKDEEKIKLAEWAKSIGAA